ncbi:MAG: type II toxin-antitoxin system prevent-host-death family antitoxin [Chloroflexi bacterium]|nr:type II toxin-antitoxin system prevent-host-death family antitoxin [Chloroflexota bacterium]
MNDLGIRELKAKASEILRTVREQGSRYVITHRGRPIAILSPVETIERSTIDPESENGENRWQELEDLGHKISVAWQSEQSSAEILAAMRR